MNKTRSTGIFRLAAACALSAFAMASAWAADPSVVIATSLGNITVELNQEKAPVTVKNFIQYVQDKQYDGMIFHRVIPNFMIQGGGFTPDMHEKATRTPIRNEASNGLKNMRGSIAMARTADPDSATDQFFINTVNNSSLDYPRPDGHGYAVFGKVTSGMEVVDKISAVRTGNAGPYSDVPVQPVLIKSIRLVASDKK